MTEKRIDPIKSVLKHCENSNCSIHDINDMCYNICNDFGNDKFCKQKCKNLINNINYNQDTKQCPSKYFPRTPVIFNNVPDNYTPYLDKLGKENSLKKCINDCNQCINCPYTKECKKKCILNNDSVTENFDNYKTSNNKKSCKNSCLLKLFTSVNIILSFIFILYFLCFL